MTKSVVVFLMCFLSFCAQTCAEDVEIDKIIFNFQSEGAVSLDAVFIANEKYSTLDDLQTPNADISKLELDIKRKGASTKKLVDMKRREILQAFAKMKKSGKADQAEVLLIYYAGHAADVDGKPTLLFGGFDPNSSQRENESLAIAEMASAVSKLGYKKVIFLFDACRTFFRASSNKRSRSISLNQRRFDAPSLNRIDLSSLSKVEYAIGFSASAEEVALDTVNGKNSPYAQALSENLESSDSLMQILANTRKAVQTATSLSQNPQQLLSWNSDFYFQGGRVTRIELDFFNELKIESYSSNNLVVVEGDSSYEKNIEIMASAELSDCVFGNKLPISFSTRNLVDCLTVNGLLKIKKESNHFEKYAGNGVLNFFDGLEIVGDFDGSGKQDAISFSTYREGGAFSWKMNGVEKEFVSYLGANAEHVSISDFNADGFVDFLVEFPMSEEPGADLGESTAIVLIDGAKVNLFRSTADGAAFCLEDNCRWQNELLHYFPQLSGYKVEKGANVFSAFGILGSLGEVVTYFDLGLRIFADVDPSEFVVEAYESSYEQLGPNLMPTKTIRPRADGSVTIDDGDSLWSLRIDRGIRLKKN